MGPSLEMTRDSRLQRQEGPAPWERSQGSRSHPRAGSYARRGGWVLRVRVPCQPLSPRVRMRPTNKQTNKLKTPKSPKPENPTLFFLGPREALPSPLSDPVRCSVCAESSAVLRERTRCAACSIFPQRKSGPSLEELPRLLEVSGLWSLDLSAREDCVCVSLHVPPTAASRHANSAPIQVPGAFEACINPP